MPRNSVGVTFEEVTLVNDSNREQAGVQATCSQCQHQVEAYGTGDASRRRCLALMREECPEGEENWYVDEDAGDD